LPEWKELRRRIINWVSKLRIFGRRIIIGINSLGKELKSIPYNQ